MYETKQNYQILHHLLIIYLFFVCLGSCHLWFPYCNCKLLIKCLYCRVIPLSQAVGVYKVIGTSRGLALMFGKYMYI